MKNGKLCCDRCDGEHETEQCPIFKKPRDDHPDATRRKPPEMGRPGGNFVLQNARVVRQPGDGSCLFHSMTYGLGTGSARTLRRELAQWIERNPETSIADTPVRDWVRWDSNRTVSQYARSIGVSGWGGGMEMAAHSERLVGVREELYVDMGPAASAAVASAVNKLVSRGGLLSVHNRLRLARGNPVLRDQGVDTSLPLHQLMDRLHPKLRMVLVGSEATRSRFASLVAAVAQQDIKTGRTQRTQFAADHIFQARNVDEELDSFRTLTVTEGGHIVERAALDAERDGARERDNSRILPAYLREVARHWRDAGLGEWRLPLLRDPRTSVRISGVVSPRDTGVGERRERKGVCVLREVKE